MKTKPSFAAEKGSRRRLALPLFIAFILVTSAFGVVFSGYTQDSSSEVKVKVGDVTLVQQPTGRWTTQTKGISLDLQFGPEDLRSLPWGVDIAALRDAAKIYLTRDPSANTLNAAPDLYNNLKPLAPLFMACTGELPGCENMPLKTCADARDGIAVISLLASPENKILYADGCYSLEGESIFVNQAADRLILEYLGVSLS